MLKPLHNLDSRAAVLAVMVAVMVCGCANETDTGKTEFESAFREASLPWYDVDTNSLASSPVPSRPDSSVADRDRIPPKSQSVGRAVKRQPVGTGGGGAAAAGASSVGSTFIYIVGGILAALLVGLLLYGFFKLEANKDDTSDAKGRRKIRDHIKHLPFEIDEQEGDFETFAEKSLREGDYNNAVIYLFADLLVAMSESGVVRLQRGKTNRQYLNDIWDFASIKPYYRNVMIAFEDAFFGKHQIDRERAEECFAGRSAFDAELEKIRAARFSAQAHSPTTSVPTLQIKTTG